MITPQKNKGHTAEAPKRNTWDNQYRLSCFVCFRPMDGTGNRTHNSEVTHRDGTAVVIVYEVCKGCTDQLSRIGTSQFSTMGRINVELEALATRIVEQEVLG